MNEFARGEGTDRCEAHDLYAYVHSPTVARHLYSTDIIPCSWRPHGCWIGGEPSNIRVTKRAAM